MNNPKPQEWKSEELSKGRIIDYKAFNFVDGEGVRNSLYVSGCMFHCEGCYNAATWSFNAGIPYTQELEEQIRLGGALCAGADPSRRRTISQYRHSTALGQADSERASRQGYLVLDGLHLGGDDAGNGGQAGAAESD